MQKNFLILLLSIFIFNCNSGDDNSGTIDIADTTIAQSSLYGNGEEGITKQNLVITTQSQWNALTNKMNSVNNATDGFSELDIDFSKYRVIAAFDDVKPNNGYGLQLEVKSNSKNLIVETSEVLTDDKYVGYVHIQPYHIIKIENLDLPIVFE